MNYEEITVGQLIRCLPDKIIKLRGLDNFPWEYNLPWNVTIVEILGALAREAVESGRLRQCADGTIQEQIHDGVGG